MHTWDGFQLIPRTICQSENGTFSSLGKTESNCYWLKPFWMIHFSLCTWECSFWNQGLVYNYELQLAKKILKGHFENTVQCTFEQIISVLQCNTGSLVVIAHFLNQNANFCIFSTSQIYHLHIEIWLWSALTCTQITSLCDR